MNNAFIFGNKVVKQGNSLCVRIPSYVVKEAGLTEGKKVALILETNQVFDEALSADLFVKISRSIRKLDKYDDAKINFFIALQFQFMKEAMDESGKEQKKFFRKLRKEYSDALINQYQEWRDFLDEAYVCSKDGSFSVKSEYFWNTKKRK